MAFPTSPSNNQIHTENNRNFVYNSSLGVWDQVPNSPLNLHKEGIINYPIGHVIQTVRNEINSYVTSSGSTEAWETDAKDLHITVTAGNMVVAWIGGGMINAETGVEGYRTSIRFSEAGGTANQDMWTTTHIGGNFTPDLYHPMMVISASVIAAHTGEMLIKRGTDNSGGSNTNWASDNNSSYGRVYYTAMEIQQ